MWKLIIIIIFCFVMPSQLYADNTYNGCDFSKLNLTHRSDFLPSGIINKVSPQYPLAAKYKKIGGTVKIRVLINAQGLVEQTCPVYSTGERPNRSLVIAAESAALLWKFKPNFGFDPENKIRFEYIYEDIIFQFNPDSYLSNNKEENNKE